MYTQELPTEAELRAWDWRDSLRAVERDVPWLARKTGKAQTTVYAYSYGNRIAPLDWLQSAWRILAAAA